MANQSEVASASIVKVDDEKRLVFGWASIIKDEGGKILLDRQDDFIDSEDELEKAAYDYVLHSRDGGEMHVRRGVAKMVESVVFTEEKQRALGIPAGSMPTGWWIGFKVEDDRVWSQVKKGEYMGFSVHGTGKRESTELPVSKITEIGKADGKKKNKVSTVMNEFKAGKLKSSSGEVVTDPKQAMAIAISEQKRAKMKKVDIETIVEKTKGVRSTMDKADGTLVQALSVLLADTVSVYHEAHGFHWNVKGSDFSQYHGLFGEIYEDLYGSVDPIAENILKMGSDAPFQLSQFVGLRTIPESQPANDPQSMAMELLDCVNKLVSTLNRAFEVANANNQQGIANFIAERIDKTQKWAWQLRSSVGVQKGDKPGHPFRGNQHSGGKSGRKGKGRVITLPSGKKVSERKLMRQTQAVSTGIKNDPDGTKHQRKERADKVRANNKKTQQSRRDRYIAGLSDKERKAYETAHSDYKSTIAGRTDLTSFQHEHLPHIAGANAVNRMRGMSVLPAGKRGKRKG